MKVGKTTNVMDDYAAGTVIYATNMVPVTIHYSFTKEAVDDAIQQYELNRLKEAKKHGELED